MLLAVLPQTTQSWPGHGNAMGCSLGGRSLVYLGNIPVSFLLPIGTRNGRSFVHLLSSTEAAESKVSLLLSMLCARILLSCCKRINAQVQRSCDLGAHATIASTLPAACLCNEDRP